jgi:uncharacterized membrane protein YdjX (TVP38/TMEM64 family)
MASNTKTAGRFNANIVHWIKLSLLLLFLAVVVGIAWVNGAGMLLQTERIAILLENFGPLAPIGYILLRIFGVMIIVPSLPLDALGGAIFGPFLGAVYSICGTIIGALICFSIARSMGKEGITRLLKKDITFCEQCTERHLIYMIFFARLLPMISFDLISYGAGLTHISTRGFALATLLGLVPLTFAVSYTGKSFLSASRTSLILGAIFVVLFFLVPIWIKRRNPWGLYERMTKIFRAG